MLICGLVSFVVGGLSADSRDSDCSSDGSGDKLVFYFSSWDFLVRSAGRPGPLKAIVDLVARSSTIMGEEVTVREEDKDCFLIHTGCPWLESYRRARLGGRCRPGCDRWFTSTLAGLHVPCAVETLSSLADGGLNCTRRFYRKEVA